MGKGGMLMAGRLALLTLACGLALGLAACQKIPTSYDERGITFIDAIPADVGTLVGVTAAGPTWAQLWYQKPDKRIVVVTVEASQGRILKQIVTIPRESESE
jgi:hypothetical protein